MTTPPDLPDPPADLSPNRPDDLERILQSGEAPGIWTELDRHRDRLRRMVALRMDSRLKARLDASDVVQEALLEAYRRLPEYLDRRDLPFAVWIRFVTLQKTKQLHRFHLGTQRRAADREAQPLAASTALLADHLAASGLSASEAARKNESLNEMREALDRLSETDREILALRHYEQLGNREIADILDLEPATASQRYLRAIQRLKSELTDPS